MTLASRLALAVLALTVVVGGAAWRLQADAAAETATALTVQRAPVPQGSSKPPSLQQNEQVLIGLNRSIAIRRRIETMLSQVQGLVADLAAREQEGRGLADAAGGEVRRIAASLGGAATASRRSMAGLSMLRGKLRIASLLARLIDRELARLDRKLGPSAGGKP